MRITSMHWAPRQPLAVADSAPCTWDLMPRVPHGVTNSPDQLLPHQRMLGTPTAVVRCWTHAPGSQYPPGSIELANFEQRSSQVGAPGVLHTAPDNPPTHAPCRTLSSPHPRPLCPDHVSCPCMHIVHRLCASPACTGRPGSRWPSPTLHPARGTSCPGCPTGSPTPRTSCSRINGC